MDLELVAHTLDFGVVIYAVGHFAVEGTFASLDVSHALEAFGIGCDQMIYYPWTSLVRDVLAVWVKMYVAGAV